MHSGRSRVGVLFGGEGAARAQSLASRDAVHAVLAAAGRPVEAIYVDEHLDLALRQARIDVAFLALHGRGADGTVQGLLESLAIPYTGSSVGAAAAAADRRLVRDLCRLHNLPVTPYYCHHRGLGGAAEQHGAFGYPCVVKPRGTGGGAAGGALAGDAHELAAAVEAALWCDDEALVERHLAGRLVEVVLLDDEVLGVAELGVAGSGGGEVPSLAPSRLAVVRTLAQRAVRALGCEGLTRVSLVVSPDGNETIVDVEAAPALGPGEVAPAVAEAVGVGLDELVERMLDRARLRGRGRRHCERRSVPRVWLGGARRAVGAGEPH